MNAKSIYRKALQISTKLFGAEKTKIIDARIRFQTKLDLKNPVTLSDKLSYLALHMDEPLKVMCTDKYAVRDYVTGKGLGSILVPLCHDVCSDVNEIQYDLLPNQFVMKATHGSGMNLICDDKTFFGCDYVLSTAKKFLDNEYDRACIEPHYKKIPHRVIFEELLDNADDIIDYKFHCFHGTPDFVLTCRNRCSGVKFKVYNMDWEPLDVVVGQEKDMSAIKRPEMLEKMIDISKQLSADFDFVRVDLYEISGKIYFGELTFTPESGVLHGYSKNFIKEKGSLLNIEMK